MSDFESHRFCPFPTTTDLTEGEKATLPQVGYNEELSTTRPCGDLTGETAANNMCLVFIPLLGCSRQREVGLCPRKIRAKETPSYIR